MVKHLLLSLVLLFVVGTVSAQSNFSFDINRMSPDVQQKLSSNKQSGAPLFSGIGKAYSIEVNNVSTLKDVELNYGFLRENNQVLQIAFLEKNKIEVTVTSAYPSEQLKGIFLQKKMSVNFLDEYFKVMNSK
ncbi:MAG TPA: hypothetical protein PLG57_13565 [Bacteroidia bacterium]|jgi:hypothetical protein|nr:hypothetical protein [Bacteroidia bacterium]HQK98269.1 hypothetical protein [Bacteroidia bacterium]